MGLVTTEGDFDESDFLSSWEQWHSHRINDLQKPYGWLSITELRWLELDQQVQIDHFPGTFISRSEGVLYNPDANSGLVTISESDAPILVPQIFAPLPDSRSVELCYASVHIEIVNRWFLRTTCAESRV